MKKLSALYTVFNGIELLDKSISQIWNEIDVLILCVQKISNTGNKTDQSKLPAIIEKYKSKIHVLHFKPNLNLTTKQNERNKLQMRIDYARLIGCTHFIQMACDHYYKSDEFNFYKNLCFNEDYDITFTEMNTYYKKPIYLIWPRENYYMPFITKLYPQTRVMYNKNYPVHADPSVMVNTTTKHRIFKPDEILLHHFTAIRENIDDKYKNAAASIRWSQQDVERFKKEYKNAKPGMKIQYFQNREITEVKNIFNI
jgi:hypothetical protein